MAQENLNFRIVAIDKTRQAFASVRNGLQRVQSSVFNLRNSIIALGGALALREFATQIDDLAKQSARLSVPVQTLQELQFAAAQTGTEAAALKTGFQRFTKSISEASTGLSTPLRAFEALGVQITNTDGSLRDTETILNDVADGMATLENPADKVRIAFDLFGKAGAGMVNMLQGGSEKLRRMRDEFSDLTIELTGEQAAAVEDANDRFDLLRRIFNSIGQQITATVLPALAGLATTMTTVVIAAMDLGITAVRGFLNSIITLVNFVSGPKFKDIEKFEFGEKFQEQIRAIVVEAQNLDVASKPLEKITANVAQGFDRSGTSLEKAKDALTKYAEAARETKAALADVALRGVKNLENSILGIIDGTKSAKDAFKDMARSIISDIIKIQIQRSITGPLASAIGNLSFFGGGKAIGGSVQSGGTYLVGERGPELFTPNAAGSIVPNKDFAAGGVTVNQTVNISTGVSQTVRAEIADLLPQIQNAAKSAVIDARRRGGSFASAFGS